MKPADPTRYKEEDCAAGIKGLLTLLNVEWYSTEAGYMGHFDKAGNRHDRPGGTRTTAGIPDLLAYPDNPFNYALTVEFKGHSTDIRTEQWEYARRRMERGEAHLIVRSPTAFLWGLRYLGLLPNAWEERPPVIVPGQASWEDIDALPVNANYLPRTRSLFWDRRNIGGDRFAPAYARRTEVRANRLKRPPDPDTHAGIRIGPDSPLR